MLEGGECLSRALDHFVLATADLDALGERFAALGFTVGGVNFHPFGTKNRIIQLADATFLELVAVADAGKIIPPGPGGMNFPGFVQRAAIRRPGMAMLALKSADAKADAAEFAAAGLGDFAPFHFARQGRLPDGSRRDLAFTLAFARVPAMPECGFFTCQQHFPENFWSEQAQRHANGVTGVSRVTLVAENPSDHHIFLGALTGTRAMRATSFGIEIAAGRGVIEVASAEGFALRYGIAAPAARTPLFAALEFHGAKLPRPGDGTAHGGGITFPPRQDFVTALRFVPRAMQAP